MDGKWLEKDRNASNLVERVPPSMRCVHKRLTAVFLPSQSHLLRNLMHAPSFRTP